MVRRDRLATSLVVVLLLGFAAAAWAQKSGGVLRIAVRESPGSPSLIEESSIYTNLPFMGLFNNLVLFDQQDKIARPETIRPDLATEWSWNAENTVVTFKLREGVKWHDGKPFTSADVKCTWDTILGKRDSGWRKNVRKEWYTNLKDVSVNGPYEVRFTLERPQPSFMSILAVGWSAVYPCHVDGRAMRQKPIGTGPYKFGEYKPNELIRVVKNTDYWKPGVPYLDAIEYRIMPSLSTRTLAFVAGQFDVTGPSDVTPPILKDIKSKVPNAVCETFATAGSSHVLINHSAPQLQDPRVRRAINLALDRHAFIAYQQGLGRLGGAMMSAPYGVWGLTPEQLERLPGFGKDIEKSRAEARKLMEEAGYGPNKRLKVSYLVRQTSVPIQGATMVADQLRSIYIDGDVDAREYSILTNMLMKGAYTLGFHGTGNALDDPDVILVENFMCNSPRNYTKYCSKEIEAKIQEQSVTLDPKKRKELVTQIDMQLEREGAKPTLFQSLQMQCWHPHVKGWIKGGNGNYSHHRFESVWIDK
jgi:peptide/nickel transport system substrate-binding protein